MFKIRVLVLVALLVGSAHSFSWDIILGVPHGIEFYYNDTLTFKQNIPSYYIQSITYDPVHDRVLFVDSNYPKTGTTTVSSFDVSTKTIKTLVTRPWNGQYNARIIFEPITQVLFWLHGGNITSYSLNPASSNAVDGNNLFMLDHVCTDIAVDSREGYIYWITNINIERARLDGSEREVLIDSIIDGLSLAIDEQRMYWIEKKLQNGAYQLSIESANFSGKERKTLYIISREYMHAYSLAVSRDFVYWQNYNQVGIMQLAKNLSQPAPRKLYTITNSDCWACHRLVVKYTTNELILGVKSDDGLQHQNSSKSESSVSICQNYCLQGDCNVTAEGKPICSCKTGYSGERCEINACHKHCLNDGVCSLNEENQPVCQCTAGYDGKRCDISICKDFCLQGNCSVSIGAKPKCRCKDGYSGERCEMNVCNNYCSNNGVCSLNEEDEPVCECTAEFEGKRCDVAITRGGKSDCDDNTMEQVLEDLRSDAKKVLKDVKRILQFFCNKIDEYEAKI